MILLTLFSIANVLIIVWWCIRYYRITKTSVDIPQPGLPFPLLGHIMHATSPKNAYFDAHRLLSTVGKYKSLIGCIGLYTGILTADPVLLEFIMTHTCAIDKSILYRFIHRWVGTGLLTSVGNKWRQHRKLLTPSYHFKILEQFIDVFDKNTSILIKHLRKEVDTEKTNIYSFISLCALDTICETAMGISINAQENSQSEYVRAIKDMSKISINRSLSIIKQIDLFYSFTKDYQREIKAVNILHNYTLSVISTRRAELLKKANQNIKLEEDLEIKKKIPFLDLLLQASLEGKPLSDDDIREEVDTFMFEGHDTVTSAISFCVYLLSKNPKIQDEIIAEQRCIYLDNPHRTTTSNDLHEMKYLEMVIKESMRLYPPVAIFGRVLTEDIKFGNNIFQKGLQVGFLVYTLHRNPEIYPDPERFDPLRFTPEMQAKRHSFAYLPFSAGHRNCIGQKFAMLEMKMTLSKLLRNYIFSEAIDNQLELTSGLILTSANGIPVKISERKW